MIGRSEFYWMVALLTTAFSLSLRMSRAFTPCKEAGDCGGKERCPIIAVGRVSGGPSREHVACVNKTCRCYNMAEGVAPSNALGKCDRVTPDVQCQMACKNSTSEIIETTTAYACEGDKHCWCKGTTKSSLLKCTEERHCGFNHKVACLGDAECMYETGLCQCDVDMNMTNCKMDQYCTGFCRSLTKSSEISDLFYFGYACKPVPGFSGTRCFCGYYA